MKKNYVQYGCGLCAPAEWVNFDASPTLRIQKMPILGWLLKSHLNTTFPANVRYGDIVKGLPIDNDSCEGLYCSHILEHLALDDFRRALKNSYKVLKKGGVFRCVVPDLEVFARQYLSSLDQGNTEASIEFMGIHTHTGIAERHRGLKGWMTLLFGNSHHLWMWDNHSLKKELEAAGFVSIRACHYHDSEDPMFMLVEDVGRFKDAVTIECRK